MSKFNTLCESLTQMKMTKVMRYPKQINLSEEFVAALDKEIQSHLTIDESKELPIKNFKDKFLKALNFHVTELNERHCRRGKKKKVVEHCGTCPKPDKTAVKMMKKRKKGPIVSGQSNPGGLAGSSKATGAL